MKIFFECFKTQNADSEKSAFCVRQLKYVGNDCECFEVIQTS